MSFSCHLPFNGNCEEAMQFYADTFGATVRFKLTWGDSPLCDQVGEELRDKIMHMSLKLGETEIMGSDVPPQRYGELHGVDVSVAFDDLAKAREVFHALADGGTVLMPFEESFWAKGFGMVTDRYHIPWMVNCAKPMDGQ